MSLKHQDSRFRYNVIALQKKNLSVNTVLKGPVSGL